MNNAYENSSCYGATPYFFALDREDAKNPWIVAATRLTTARYLQSHLVSPQRAADFLVDQYARYVLANEDTGQEMEIVDRNGGSAGLNLDVYLPTDDEIDAGLAENFYEQQRNWFRRAFYTLPEPNAIPRVSEQHLQRYLVTVNIVGSLLYDSGPSAFWPRREDFKSSISKKHANDNFKSAASGANRR